MTNALDEREQLLTVAEVAMEIGCSAPTVRRWIREGHLTALLRRRYRVFFRRERLCSPLLSARRYRSPTRAATRRATCHLIGEVVA